LLGESRGSELNTGAKVEKKKSKRLYYYGRIKKKESRSTKIPSGDNRARWAKVAASTHTLGTVSQVQPNVY